MTVLPERKSNDLIPDKLFYRIGEVSRITGVEPYVLRYWETEFPFLRPRKSNSGHRIYTKRDIELVLEIKRLLYEEKYTIEGVRKKFGVIKKISDTDSKEDKGGLRTPDRQFRQKISEIKQRLQNLLDILK